MKLLLEITNTSDITVMGRCGCGKWESDQYTLDERELMFAAWGEHCELKHRPKGVDAASQT